MKLGDVVYFINCDPEFVPIKYDFMTTIDLADSSDRTAYIKFKDGKFEQITKEEYECLNADNSSQV